MQARTVSLHRKIPATLLPFDLADPEARLEAARNAIAMHGRIDLLMLNAGVSQRALFQDTTAEVFNLIMETIFFCSSGYRTSNAAAAA